MITNTVGRQSGVCGQVSSLQYVFFILVTAGLLRYPFLSGSEIKSNITFFVALFVIYYFTRMTG